MRISALGSPGTNSACMNALPSCCSSRLQQINGKAESACQGAMASQALWTKRVSQQRAVGIARGRLHGEHQNAGGVAVEPVHRCQCADADLSLEAPQHGPMQLTVAGGDGAKLELARRQVPTAVQKFVLARHARRRWRISPVPEQHAHHARRASGQWPAHAARLGLPFQPVGLAHQIAFNR